MNPVRRLVTVTAALIVPLSAPAIAATGQWKPEQTVEIVIGSAPGSGPDRNARVMQKIFQDGRFIPVPVVVMNRPVVANVYVSKFEGNGHYLLMSGKGLITTDIMGRLPFSYADLTPITHTMDEYIGIAVKADSPLKSGRDLLDRLRKDPAAHSVGVATSLGNANHQAVAAAMKATGIEPRKGRYVIFNSGGAAMTALLGGHVDLVPVSLGVLVPELQVGRIRILAVSAPQRVAGAFADIPTWREQGADAVVSVWRGAFGAKGLSPAQIAYWEAVFQRLIAAPEWQKEIETVHAVSAFMGSAKTREYMERDYAAQKSLLADLGLVGNQTAINVKAQ
jgi:putative tricarboxylic transport membrane protein